MQLFSCSRSSEVSLISRQFLKEIGPEQALQRERGGEQNEERSQVEPSHRSADLEVFGKSNRVSFLAGLFSCSEQQHNHTQRPVVHSAVPI